MPSSTISVGEVKGPHLLFVQGNIGAGKTTLAQGVVDSLAHEGVRAVFVKEPVDLWDAAGLLRGMYSGELNRSVFQVVAASTRYARINDEINRARISLTTDDPIELLVIERSIATDRIFADLNMTEGSLEKAAYTMLADQLEPLTHSYRSYTVVVDVDVATSIERIGRRNRTAEMVDKTAKETTMCISREYLEDLRRRHHVYFEQLSSDDVMLLDAHDDVPVLVDRVLSKIYEVFGVGSVPAPTAKQIEKRPYAHIDHTQHDPLIPIAKQGRHTNATMVQ
jgi:deoxyadenosine/deoxycytidine kinase